MNHQSFGIKKSSLIIASVLLGNSYVMAGNLQVTWLDSSNNEDGFTVEKRLMENDDFELISYLPADTTLYVDANVVTDQTYCYRIASYNQAGKSTSEESCIEVNEADVEYNDAVAEEDVESSNNVVISEPTSSENIDSDAVSKPVYTYSDITISHEFINKPAVIEIGEKELHSFKSNENFNTDYSSNDIVNADFLINQGKVYYSNSAYSFQKNGVELSNGYASMAFNTTNNLSFDLLGNGTKQTATLYMQAGAWTSQASSVVVTVGDKTENIELPKGYAWTYFTVDIEFDGTTPVTITTDSDRSGYSAVMFAGIVLNEADVIEAEAVEVEAVKYASLLDIDSKAEKVINITDVKFMTSAWQGGNDELSAATVSELSYTGKTKAYTSTYQFVNDNGQTYLGHESMSWSEDNGVKIQLQSGESQVNTVALYFAAGAWTKELASVEVIINGESEVIDLSSGFSWKYYKVEVEFEGELDIEIRPVGTLSGYSAMKFAGLTLN
jgi:hypothetical protein